MNKLECILVKPQEIYLYLSKLQVIDSVYIYFQLK